MSLLKIRARIEALQAPKERYWKQGKPFHALAIQQEQLSLIRKLRLATRQALDRDPAGVGVKIFCGEN